MSYQRNLVRTSAWRRASCWRRSSSSASFLACSAAFFSRCRSFFRAFFSRSAAERAAERAASKLSFSSSYMPGSTIGLCCRLNTRCAC